MMPTVANGRSAGSAAQTSGVSGPAYASATPRVDPVPAASASGPTTAELGAAWEAYKGQFKGPLAPLPGQPDLNVLSNRCGPIVRTGVDFLFGPVLKIQTKAGSETQAILDAVWGDEDRRMTTLSKCRMNGGVFGHVLVKIVTPRNRRPMSAANPPRFVVQNPELYTVETDPNDCDLVTRYVCTWQGTDADGEPCWHRQTTTRVDPDADDATVASGEDEDTHWEIQNWVKVAGAGNDAQDWQAVGPALVWPYPFAPIADWQNYPNPNAHWGANDLDAAVINLNKQLHLVESNTNAVIYSHGHPWIFATGADTAGITPTPGVIIDLGSTDAKVFPVMAGGDVMHMQSYAEQLRGNMDEASSTPGVATGRMSMLPRGALSGITVRLLYGPRIMRTEHERRLYGGGIRQLCRAALVLCGQEAAAQDEVTLTWQDPLPQDDLAMAQMALTLQQLGVSDHSIYALIGLNYETELEYKQQEALDQQDALARGVGLPAASPVPPAVPGSPDGSNGSGDGQQQQQASANTPANRPGPPVNHPAAVAARVAVKAAGAAMRGAK